MYYDKFCLYSPEGAIMLTIGWRTLSSLPVMWQRWLSPFAPPYPKTPMLYASIMAVCFIEWESLPIKWLKNRNFGRFWLLWPWPWPYDLHIWTWPTCPGDKLKMKNENEKWFIAYSSCHVRIWFSYVKAFESNRLTDIQTETTEVIYDAASWVVNKALR